MQEILRRAAKKAAMTPAASRLFTLRHEIRASTVPL
jgi:hypothetical protein